MYGIHQIVNNLFRATLIPGFFIWLWLSGLIALTTLKLCLIACLIIFVILPLIFKYSVSLQRSILFLTAVAYPRTVDFKNPETVGLHATRNFYVKVKDPDGDVDTINIGVWHVLPVQIAQQFSKELQISDPNFGKDTNDTTINELTIDEPKINEPSLDSYTSVLRPEFPIINDENRDLFYERVLRRPGTVILYLHGNTSSRGAPHRVELFKILQKLGYHVFALDYRGYGDSDKIQPTEEGVVQDAIAVYEHIRNLTENNVVLWGHSLGTGVSTHMLALLNKRNVPGPSAVVLESPFNNIRDEVRHHPFAKLFKNLPWFDYMIAKPMHANCLRFESDRHISEFKQPVLILHAEDDLVVPFQLGYKLYRAALDNRARSWGPVEFHRFEGSSNYGHKWLCRAPNLPDIIKTFINNYQNVVY